MTYATHLTRAYIHLDRLTHNVRLLQELAGERPLWPAIKANAYGHGIEMLPAIWLGAAMTHSVSPMSARGTIGDVLQPGCPGGLEYRNRLSV